MAETKTRCLIVYPKFNSLSFWNYTPTCELVGASYPAAPLGLITVAAILPQEWEIELVDCNCEELTDEKIKWADLVLSGGMIAQQGSHLALIERVKKFNKPHMVGGPDATSTPQLYEAATHLVLGEAEITLPRFIKDWDSGGAKHIYAAGDEKADVSTSPIPRFDLLNFDNYLHVGIQFSRGCPFNCEFCDIIELFGRVPRTKAPDQIVAQLDRLYELGYRGHVDLVDDNFIGNRNAAKKLLPKMKEWLDEHKYPFEFSTEATINLADDDALLEMMQDVGFSAIFVGIETPDESTLKQTQKNQNTKRNISDNIKRINQAGIFVNAGYIVGFDNEKGSVAQSVIDHIELTSIPVNMVGLLFALPNTQLARRLLKEGRLEKENTKQPANVGDQCLAGLNFKTLRPRLEVIEDYRKIVDQSFSPAAYFGRVRNLTKILDCSRKKLRLPMKHQVRDIKAFFKLILFQGILSDYKWQFWKTLIHCVFVNPRAIRYTVALIALYLHFGSFKKYLVKNLDVKVEKESFFDSIKQTAVGGAAAAAAPSMHHSSA